MDIRTWIAIGVVVCFIVVMAYSALVIASKQKEDEAEQKELEQAVKELRDFQKRLYEQQKQITIDASRRLWDEEGEEDDTKQ